jgi:hypothetical protein
MHALLLDRFVLCSHHSHLGALSFNLSPPPPPLESSSLRRGLNPSLDKRFVLDSFFHPINMANNTILPSFIELMASLGLDNKPSGPGVAPSPSHSRSASMASRSSSSLPPLHHLSDSLANVTGLQRSASPAIVVSHHDTESSRPNSRASDQGGSRTSSRRTSVSTSGQSTARYNPYAAIVRSLRHPLLPTLLLTLYFSFFADWSSWEYAYYQPGERSQSPPRSLQGKLRSASDKTSARKSNRELTLSF